MEDQVLLGCCHFFGIQACLFGIYQSLVYSTSALQLICCVSGFLLGLMSNVFGLTYITYELVFKSADMSKVYWYFEKQHAMAWFGVVVGYPAAMGGLWMFFDPGCFEFVSLGLICIPTLIYMFKLNYMVAPSTKILGALCVLSNLYVCYYGLSLIGQISTVVMLLNIFCMTIPTKYKVFGFTSREAFVTGCGVYSVCLGFTLADLAAYADKEEPIEPSFWTWLWPWGWPGA